MLIVVERRETFHYYYPMGVHPPGDLTVTRQKKKSRRMAENNIPYKVRAALLLVPLNTPMPTGAVTRSLWYIAVRSGDVHRVQHYLRTERDT